jgi:hypothetical protein
MKTPPDFDDSSLAFRLGAATLGALAGMAFGLLIGAISSHPGLGVLSGAIAGSVTGAFFPHTSLGMLFGLVHFVAGIFTVAHPALFDELGDEFFRGSSSWLNAMFVFGVLYAILAWILFSV